MAVVDGHAVIHWAVGFNWFVPKLIFIDWSEHLTISISFVSNTGSFRGINDTSKQK